MSMTLKNGYGPTTVFEKLQNLKEENPTALWNLVMKCKNVSHKIEISFISDPEKELKDLQLLNKKGLVPEDVRNVIYQTITNIADVGIARLPILCDQPPSITTQTLDKRDCCIIM